MLIGAALIEAIPTSHSDAAFWWLGQHTFMLKMGGTTVLIRTPHS